MDENTWEFKGRGHPVTVSCGCHTQIWVKSSGHVASSERPLSNRKPLRCPPRRTRRPHGILPAVVKRATPTGVPGPVGPGRDVRLRFCTNERHDLIQETWVRDTQSVP